MRDRSGWLLWFSVGVVVVSCVYLMWLGVGVLERWEQRERDWPEFEDLGDKRGSYCVSRFEGRGDVYMSDMRFSTYREFVDWCKERGGTVYWEP